MEDTYYSCPYCGFYAEGGTLVAINDHSKYEQKKRTQLLKKTGSNRLPSKGSLTLQPAIQTHIATSISLSSQTASKGKSRTLQW
jgi:hypothetical protein